MKLKTLTPEARRALELLPDEWTPMPVGFRVGDGLADMTRRGLVEHKRGRPFPKAPHRVSVRRTAKGREALGLEAALTPNQGDDHAQA